MNSQLTTADGIRRAIARIRLAFLLGVVTIIAVTVLPEVTDIPTSGWRWWGPALIVNGVILAVGLHARSLLPRALRPGWSQHRQRPFLLTAFLIFVSGALVQQLAGGFGGELIGTSCLISGLLVMVWLYVRPQAASRLIGDIAQSSAVQNR